MLVQHASVAWHSAFGEVIPTTSFTFLADASPHAIAGATIAHSPVLVEPDAGDDCAISSRQAR
jgi:hypothetical protein